MLKTFEECPQKFFLKYIERMALPQRSTIFEKGKKVHALANYYLNGENIEKMEKILTVDEKLAWEALKSSEYFKLKVFNTEYNLSCKVDKYWIGGRLDALVFHGKDYFILDYKTGNLPQNAEQDFQTIVYLLSTDKFLIKKGGYNSLKFIYLGLKEDKQKEILLTPSLKKQYEEKIVETCKKIDLAVFSGVFSQSKERCKNCEFNKLCNT
jgi:CRISPR/Cas system-associated exonuclease Cas4 (RecB family)